MSGPPPTAEFTSSVWGIHDAANPNDARPLPSGCGWYRVVMPLEQLKAHGWKAEWQAGTPATTVADR